MAHTDYTKMSATSAAEDRGDGAGSGGTSGGERGRHPSLKRARGDGKEEAEDKEQEHRGRADRCPQCHCIRIDEVCEGTCLREKRLEGKDHEAGGRIVQDSIHRLAVKERVAGRPVVFLCGTDWERVSHGKDELIGRAKAIVAHGFADAFEQWMTKRKPVTWTEAAQELVKSTGIDLAAEQSKAKTKSEFTILDDAVFVALRDVYLQADFGLRQFEVL